MRPPRLLLVTVTMLALVSTPTARALLAKAVAADAGIDDAAAPGGRDLAARPSPPAHAGRNPIPPRRQWNENSGYCGEVSFISAGLYFGQYVSQFEARRTIGRQNRAQILVGENDRRAARHLHLLAEEWNPTHAARTSNQFLAWIKRHVLRGLPVIIGVYNNEARLYGNLDPAAGDPTYDHIVGVVGLRSSHALRSPRAYPDDQLIFTDNGLWGTGPTRQYFFRATFSRFPADRARANAPDGPVYSLPAGVPNYGVTITGIVDSKRETLPVRLSTSVNFERPEIVDGTDQRPQGRSLTLTITVSGLEPGRAYNLYRYASLGVVPGSDFNAHADRAAESWRIRIESGSRYTFRQVIDSNDVAVYRAVRADKR